MMVWTEIYCYIKGSAEAHLYYGNFISRYDYKILAKSRHSDDELVNIIYKIFLYYEDWKYD